MRIHRLYIYTFLFFLFFLTLVLWHFDSNLTNLVHIPSHFSTNVSSNRTASNNIEDSIPIAVIAYKRPQYLEQTLKSLLKANNIEKHDVIVYQDGNDEQVAAVVRNFYPKVILVQNTHSNILSKNDIPGKPPSIKGAAKIARHYKFVLSHVFDSYSDSKYSIICEDDMLFAPDFLTMLSSLAPLYETDPSVYCISSWNDNGFSGHVNILDTNILYRTEFFPGLGWIASRKIFQKEWEDKWPEEHWDWWVRDNKQRKNRECIYPELSRSYNIGKVGTFTDPSLFHKYFENQLLANISNTTFDLNRISIEGYEYELKQLFQQAIVVKNLTSLVSYHNELLVIYYNANSPNSLIWKHSISIFFGLWHEPQRTDYHGLHRTWYLSNSILLVASYSRYAKIYGPPYSNDNFTYFSSNDFKEAKTFIIKENGLDK